MTENLLVIGSGLMVVLGLSGLVSLRLRFALALLLSVPQFYVLQIGDAYLSLAAAASLSMIDVRTLLAQRTRENRSVTVLLLLVVCEVVSLAWSSDYRLGVKTISVSAIFLGMYSGSLRLGSIKLNHLIRPGYYFSALLLLASCSVILFRLFPELEALYLASSIAKVILGPGFVEGIQSGDILNNILDPEKSAGFLFANGNAAAAYMGISAFFMWWLSGHLHSRMLKLSALVAFVAVFFTGSKAAVVISLVLAGFIVLVSAIQQRASARSVTLAVVAAASLAGLIAAAMFRAEIDSFVAEVTQTSAIRFWIWTYAADAFQKAPFLGQGFGGWQAGFSSYSAERYEGFPPHNTLIYLWSQSGIVAPALALIFMFCVLAEARRLMRVGSGSDYKLGLTLITCSAWLFIQGMGENWGLVGESHQVALFALLLALVHIRLRSIAQLRHAAQVTSTSPSQMNPRLSWK